MNCVFVLEAVAFLTCSVAVVKGTRHECRRHLAWFCMPAWLHLISDMLFTEPDITGAKRQREWESALEDLQREVRGMTLQQYHLSRTGRDSIGITRKTHVKHTADAKLWKDHVVNKEVKICKSIIMSESPEPIVHAMHTKHIKVRT